MLIINDESTDESEALVLGFNDIRIQLYSQENQGVSVARNLGIEKAKYEYIAFLDADDLWMENHLETLKDLIETYPNAGIYASRYELVFKNLSKKIPKFNGLSFDFKGYVNDYFYATQNNSLSLTLVTAVPKSIFSAIGNFDIEITSGQDIDMWLRIALKYPIVISNKITASYLHYIEGSLSKTSILNKKTIRFNEYINEENKNPSLKKYLDIYRMEYALQYKIAGANKKSQELYMNILKENISLKSKVLYHLPQWILVVLLKTKRFLRNKGIDFSIYQ